MKSAFAIKVARRLMRLSNKFRIPDRSKAALLRDLMANPPTTQLDDWASSVQSLLHSQVMNRITKEDMATILTGIISYQATGITPAETQYALVRCYENTSGLFQEALHRVLFEQADPTPRTIHSQLVGTVGADMIRTTLAEMHETGYSVFPMKLSAEIVEHLKSQSRTLDYQLKGGQRSMNEVSGIDVTNPPACVAAFATSSSRNASAFFAQVNSDSLFEHVCSAYLGVKARAIDLSLWYTFPSEQPDAETAQLYHYDLDTVRWVKVFIYLTDVEADNGPHEYVASSHKVENSHSRVLVRNYTRVSDEDIDKFYPGKRQSVTGGAGTIIFGDTRCFHKGTAVNSGHRLIYSPIYAPSKLGYVVG